MKGTILLCLVLNLWGTVIGELDHENGHSYKLQDEDMHPVISHNRILQKEVEGADHWFAEAQKNLHTRIQTEKLERMAKNLIMFIGDGMSVSTVTGARIFKGQKEELEFGEEAQLHMDTFPYTGTAKTYCSDWQVADSACSSTAYFTGTKGNAKTIGVKPSVKYQDCVRQMEEEHQVDSILAWAQKSGMSTGIVTTTTVTHASPAGGFAHIADRDWENDDKMRQNGGDPDTCDDITEQLVFQSPGFGINVILGGGRRHWRQNGTADEEGYTGSRQDGKDLIDTWKTQKDSEGKRAKFVSGRRVLLDMDLSQVDYLLGLFATESVAYADEQATMDDPSLAEMTEVAIKILSRNPKGFFLFVEGGRIDHAHHNNWGHRALAETLQFDDAIKLADGLTEDSETLIVVSSDHSHLFNIAGDPLRGNDILDFSGNTDNLDKRPHTTLGYINGMGYKEAEIVKDEEGVPHCVRYDSSSDDIKGVDYRYVSQVPRGSATHAGEDVLIFAKGPFSHLFTGINDQTHIPVAMAYAACISPFEHNFCDQQNNAAFKLTNSSYSLLLLGFLFYLLWTQ